MFDAQDAEDELLAVRLAGEGAASVSMAVPVYLDPVQGGLFAALDFIGRHLAAFVRGLPVEEDPVGALARGPADRRWASVMRRGEES
uniref:Uncharacterized protein n=1 Tax=Candidatus Kentrum sp. SD TaxID=2126332 RepID=A0A451BI05_9GAMM|nr:MAG: hypothetical protein BECKSD772D_GA0070982_100383 [Candidatus Kentron sp. SD]